MTEERRGRLVMLVDNGVVGDSRVQKQARSAADAGWDVTLVGLRANGSQRFEWTIGEAKVELYGIPAPLRQHKSRLRWSVRRPLAYPPGQIAAYQAQMVKARRADLTARFGRLAQARTSGSSPVRLAAMRVRLLPAQVGLRAVRHWVALRTAELKRLQAGRDDPNSVLTRLIVGTLRAVHGRRSWRRLDPALWDYELALGPVVDRLKPDVIHANDYRMVGVGARAKLRAASRGRSVKLVWDAHEYVPGMNHRPGNPRWLPAQAAHEREYAVHADEVVTVSPLLAELLRKEHRLPRTPTVVLNAPDLSPALFEGPPLREQCGVGADTPLLVYCGGVNDVRGVDVAVRALPLLPGVHLALVSVHPNGNRSTVEPVEELARTLGVADRVHVLPYVQHWEVVPFLAEADAAFSGLLHLPNHEIALSNKFFEYSQARLPLLVSDVRAMSETVRATGQGEVFRAGDVAGFAAAAERVLADPRRYRAAYDAPGLLDGWTWAQQAAVLMEVYRRVAPLVCPRQATQSDPSPSMALS